MPEKCSRYLRKRLVQPWCNLVVPAHIPTIFLVLLVPFSALALEIQPAMEIEEKSIEHFLRFPKHRGNIELRIVCEIHILKAGRANLIRCHKPSGASRRFEKAISMAVRKSRFTPASVNQKIQDVMAYHTFKFSKSEDVEVASHYPHQFLNIKDYGSNYIAPQLFDRERWQMKCHSKKTVPILVKVSQTGEPVKAHALKQGEESIQCLESFLRMAMSESYIPAVADGKHVPAMFMHRFGGQTRGGYNSQTSPYPR